jgi:hypothetical protein
MKGLPPNLKNALQCAFRRKLLDYCRESFEKLLQSPLKEDKMMDEKEEDRQIREFKTKHKLFGNIAFVGELFKKHMITDNIMI